MLHKVSEDDCTLHLQELSNRGLYIQMSILASFRIWIYRGSSMQYFQVCSTLVEASENGPNSLSSVLVALVFTFRGFTRSNQTMASSLCQFTSASLSSFLIRKCSILLDLFLPPGFLFVFDFPEHQPSTMSTIYQRSQCWNSHHNVNRTSTDLTSKLPGITVQNQESHSVSSGSSS